MTLYLKSHTKSQHSENFELQAHSCRVSKIIFWNFLTFNNLHCICQCVTELMSYTHAECMCSGDHIITWDSWDTYMHNILWHIPTQVHWYPSSWSKINKIQNTAHRELEKQELITFSPFFLSVSSSSSCSQLQSHARTASFSFKIAACFNLAAGRPHTHSLTTHVKVSSKTEWLICRKMGQRSRLPSSSDSFWKWKKKKEKAKEKP